MNLLEQETRPSDDTRLIPLTKGQFAIVDASDYEWLMQWKWHAFERPHTFYAARSGKMVNGVRGKYILMHRFIVNAPDGTEVDHWNRNGLVNTRYNLRFATDSQNQWNRGPLKKNKSGFKGITFRAATGKWIVHISHHGRVEHVGVYKTPEDAARAYDSAALRLHGEFAHLNFPR